MQWKLDSTRFRILFPFLRNSKEMSLCIKVIQQPLALSKQETEEMGQYDLERNVGWQEGNGADWTHQKMKWTGQLPQLGQRIRVCNIWNKTIKQKRNIWSRTFWSCLLPRLNYRKGWKRWEEKSYEEINELRGQLALISRKTWISTLLRTDKSDP